MKRLALIAATSLLLAGCSTSTVDNEGTVVPSDTASVPDVRVFEVRLPDGNVTTCVYALPGGGLDCDVQGHAPLP